MEWLGELKQAFGVAAAVVISMLIAALIYQTKKLNASEGAHHATRDAASKALEAINEKSTTALLANATNTAQFSELIRNLVATLKSSQ